jgi:hypothetical protein
MIVSGGDKFDVYKETENKNESQQVEYFQEKMHIAVFRNHISNLILALLTSKALLYNE